MRESFLASIGSSRFLRYFGDEAIARFSQIPDKSLGAIASDFGFLVLDREKPDRPQAGIFSPRFVRSMP